MALAAEVTRVVCGTKASISASDYFLLNGMGSDFLQNEYHVWFNVGGSDSEPSGLSSTGIECDISSVSSASDVGGVVATQVGGQTDFSASNASGTVDITNAVRGAVTNASDVNTGFTITTLTEGTGLKNSTHLHPENDVVWFVEGDNLALVTTEGSDSTSQHAKLGDLKGFNESVIEGLLIHYSAEPDTLTSITTPNGGALDIDNSLHLFVVDYVKSRLFMDRASKTGDANIVSSSINLSTLHERKWKDALVKFGNRKREKVGGPRRIRPADFR
tara:strand:- start:49 stop:870 length:822 start_codon:yes stop_codon:yes gene_type:complete